MPPNLLSQPLRRLWAVEQFSYSLRVFIALASTMLFCLLTEQPEHIIPLFLGIIAGALSETDDNWRGRLNAASVTLVCFGVAAVTVEWLFPHSELFALALGCSTFSLVMLGALGERYATIASATLILSVYTMITVDQRGGETLHYWREPLLLMSGAAWYGALSIFWSALFVRQPVEQSLARVYRALAQYVQLKATLFEPCRQPNLEAQRLRLAQQSGLVVTAMNAAKEILLHRTNQAHNDRTLTHYLSLYFLAQELHERISSSHYPYQSLIDAFFHSDVLFRCQRILKLQSQACLELAQAISTQQPVSYSLQYHDAMDDLYAALAYLDQHQNPQWQPLLGSLHALTQNLERVHNQLARANDTDIDPNTDSALFDNQPHNMQQAYARLRGQLTLNSSIFRHALRMSVALVCGYLMLHAIHPDQGYWILLTTVFVCQPNYGATQTRLMQRISGTLIGLIAGWMLFTLFPTLTTQALWAVLAGTVFFISRTTHYTLATAAITLLVLLCFNQVGNGYGLILPRLFDTLLGCAIAAGAVFWILPDWQGRRLNQMAANALQCTRDYLQQIVNQYHTGKHDDLAYRLARRNAHNAEAALSSTVSSMLLEPEPFCQEAESGLRFLTLSHTLLNYLSALGAHRDDAAFSENDAEMLTQTAQSIINTLENMAQKLRQPNAFNKPVHHTTTNTLTAITQDAQGPQPFIHNQLWLIAQHLNQLAVAVEELTQDTP